MSASTNNNWEDAKVSVDLDDSLVLIYLHKLNMIFRAGCNSLPAVIRRKLLARERKLTW